MKSPLIDISSTPQQSYKNYVPQVACDSDVATPNEKAVSDKLTLDIIKQVSTTVNDAYFHSSPLFSLKVAPCMSNSTKITNNSAPTSSTSLTPTMTASNNALPSVNESSQPSASESFTQDNPSSFNTISSFIVNNGEKAYSQYVLPICFFMTGILLMFYLLHLA